MENQKLGQEPAFANGNKNTKDSDGTPNGMSKRFYAACAAMQGMLANQSVTNVPDEIVIKTAYKIADELLKQEDL